jgi:hypothetical protein
MAFSTWRPKRRKRKRPREVTWKFGGVLKRKGTVFLIIENYFSFLSSIFFSYSVLLFQ